MSAGRRGRRGGCGRECTRATSPSSAPPAPSAGRRSRSPGRTRTGCGSPAWLPAEGTSPALADQALDPRRPHGRRRPRHRGAGPAAGLLRRRVPARLGEGRVRAARDPRRSAGGRGAGRPARPTSCSTGSPARSAWGPPWRRCGPGRTVALANKESLVAGGALVDRGRGARADRARSTPSTRRWPSACAAAPAARSPGWWSPPPAARSAAGRPTSSPTSPSSRGAGPPHLGDGPGRHHQLGDPGQQGTRADRGAPALRRPLRPTSTSSCTRSRSSTRWSPSSTARRIAQASPPDMRLPIALALAWPDRLADVPAGAGLVDGRAPGSSTRSTDEAFPAVGLAPARGARPAASSRPLFNAANEEAVAAFVAGRLSFRGIVGPRRAYPRRRAGPRRTRRCVEDVRATEKWAPGAAPGGVIVRRHRQLSGITDLDHPRDRRCSRSACCSRSPCTSSGTSSGPAGSACGCRSTWSASARPSGPSRCGETEYGIKAIPLGGYIRMVGMIPPAEEGEQQARHPHAQLHRRGPRPGAQRRPAERRAAGSSTPSRGGSGSS